MKHKKLSVGSRCHFFDLSFSEHLVFRWDWWQDLAFSPWMSCLQTMSSFNAVRWDKAFRGLEFFSVVRTRSESAKWSQKIPRKQKWKNCVVEGFAFFIGKNAAPTAASFLLFVYLFVIDYFLGVKWINFLQSSPTWSFSSVFVFVLETITGVGVSRYNHDAARACLNWRNTRSEDCLRRGLARKTEPRWQLAVLIAVDSFFFSWKSFCGHFALIQRHVPKIQNDVVWLSTRQFIELQNCTDRVIVFQIYGYLARHIDNPAVREAARLLASQHPIIFVPPGASSVTPRERVFVQKIPYRTSLIFACL